MFIYLNCNDFDSTEDDHIRSKRLLILFIIIYQLLFYKFNFILTLKFVLIY